MKCATCGKESYHTKCDLRGDRKWKCELCFYGYTDGGAPIVSETKMGWEPHTLADGPIHMLPDNWPGRKYEDGVYKVDIKDQGHEKATMRALGCHFGERGEKVGGHDLMLKGRPRFGSKAFSFIGTNRKASTCR